MKIKNTMCEWGKLLKYYHKLFGRVPKKEIWTRKHDEDHHRAFTIEGVSKWKQGHLRNPFLKESKAMSDKLEKVSIME